MKKISDAKKARRMASYAMPKCSCGAVLSLVTQAAGGKKCGRCAQVNSEPLDTTGMRVKDIQKNYEWALAIYDNSMESWTEYVNFYDILYDDQCDHVAFNGEVWKIDKRGLVEKVSR